ncbi:hypothetical protein ACFL3V_04750 [Nanoarchaeota archaeon]
MLPAAGILIYSMIKKRKTIKKKWKNWRMRAGKKKEFKAMEGLLNSLEGNEKEVIRNFRELCEAVQNEKKTFDDSRHIVDKLVTDIKETIGQEREFVEETQIGEDGNISKHIEKLRGYNDPTEKSIVRNILTEVDAQLATLGEIPGELEDQLNDLENIEALFDEHSELLNTFKQHKQHSFKQKNVIKNMRDQIDDNKKSFIAISKRCDEMVVTLTTMEDDITGIVGKHADYHQILRNIKDLRFNAMKLNKLFANKINILHYLVTRLKEVEELIHTMHTDEVTNLNIFLTHAKDMIDKEHFDSAVYLAAHFIESARELEKMDDAVKTQLKDGIAEAKVIITSSLPRVFDSMKEKIQEELNQYKFKEVRTMITSIKDLEFVDKAHNVEFNNLLVPHKNKMEQLETLCNRLENNQAIRKSLYDTLGLTPPPQP